MNKIALLIPALALGLAACGQEPAPQPTEAATQAAAATPAKPTLPAPNQASFTEVLAKTCPSLKPVKVAACKRAGMGSPDVVCEYGLGDDDHLRNKAVLTAGESEWTLKDPATVCAAGA